MGEPSAQGQRSDDGRLRCAGVGRDGFRGASRWRSGKKKGIIGRIVQSFLFGKPDDFEHAPAVPEGSDGFIPFVFDGHKVRVVRIDENGEKKPWFVAADVCKFLGLSNPTDALSTIPADWKAVHKMAVMVRKKCTLGQTEGAFFEQEKNLNILSQSGMFRLVLRSDKDEAVQFQNKVCKFLDDLANNRVGIVRNPRYLREKDRLKCNLKTALMRSVRPARPGPG